MEYNLHHEVEANGWHQIVGTINGHAVVSEPAMYQGIAAIRFYNRQTHHDHIFVAVTDFHHNAIGLKAGIVYQITPIAHLE
jgi:hypothetical protein